MDDFPKNLKVIYNGAGMRVSKQRENFHLWVNYPFKADWISNKYPFEKVDTPIPLASIVIASFCTSPCTRITALFQ